MEADSWGGKGLLVTMINYVVGWDLVGIGDGTDRAEGKGSGIEWGQESARD
jgi:hypothetical protein